MLAGLLPFALLDAASTDPHTHERRETVDNKDIKITLLYNLDEVNVLLTALGTLPFNQSAALIANIREQALPQLPIAEEKQDAENN